MKYKRGCIFFILCFFAFPLFAQEAPAETEEAPLLDEEQETASKLSSSERQRIEMEIKTSTLSELAVWCRMLGLSEGGTRADLSKRISDFYKMAEAGEQSNDKRKLITIESAQASEYFTIEVIDEDYARLRGNVSLTLKDGDALHRISANEILFNRTRNIITASGGVMYEKVEDNTTETFRGESITVNIDNWSSVFLGGNVEHTLKSDGTAYLFSGEVISRNDEDVTILNKAVISSANEEALWSISASKVWLLPGSDFAILNAVLKVGEIPVLYLPFFHFPADEILFHPVIGYRSREGGFVQTTTYILGQPKASSSEESSISKILGNSNDMEKKLDGMFLRSTGKKVVDPNEISLRALIDHYINMGTYLALELAVPKTGILNPLEFTIGFGLTKTLSQVGTGYTPYAPDYDGSVQWDHSNFFSTTVPFRYRMTFNSSIGGKYGSLSWNIPYYSDPYVDRDFLNRAESMDWMNMIQQGAAIDYSLRDTAEGITSYVWQMNGNISPSFPKLVPWVQRVSVPTLSTSMSFNRKLDSSINNIEAPSRYFFAPDKYIIYSFSGAVSGTPVNIGGQSQSSAVATTDTEEEDYLKGIGVPIPPWANEDNTTEKIPSSEILTPPALSRSFEIGGTENTKFSVDYQLNPTSSSELQFMPDKWKTYEDVDWSDVLSVLTSVGGNGSVNFHFDHSKSLYSNLVSFRVQGRWLEYTYLNEEADTFQNASNTEKAIADRYKEAYRQTFYSTSYSYTGTLRPLYEDPIFGQSNLEYTFGGTLVKSKRFIDGDGPELAPQWGAWVKEKQSEDILGLSSHRLSTKIAASIMDKTQDITFGADLPPLDGLISTNANFRIWISDTNINFRIERPEERNEWVYKPVSFTETLRFGKVGTFSHYMVLTPEMDNEITLIRSTLSLWHFKADFVATRDYKYVWVPDPNQPAAYPYVGEWEKTGEPALYPRELKLSYDHSLSSVEVIKKRMSLALSISSQTTFDFQKQTNSNFELRLGITTIINNFLELRLSTISENTVIFRYFKDIKGMEDATIMYKEGEQNNLFIDLFDSFNFLDDSKRRRSGFKINGLSLKATHYLGDWRADLTVDMYPYRKNNSQTFEITTDIGFLVQWKPIMEIKSDIAYDGRNDRWVVK